SNMKQIGLGLMQYAQDNDEYFPVRYGSSNPGDFIDGRQRTWKDMLMPYIKNRDVYRCPSNPAARLADTKGYFPAGYSMFLPNGPFSIFEGGAAYPQHLAGIGYPANSIIIFETSYLFPDGGPYQAYTEPSIPSATLAPAPSSWNSGHSKKKGNMVFMDGH